MFSAAGDGVTSSTRHCHNPLRDGVTTFHDGIEQRSQKEQPPPSVVFWLEHRMRKAVGYLRDMRILDMSGQGMWVCDHEHTRWRQSCYSSQTRNQIHGSIEPLHFKPMCLASDCAKSGIAIKVVLPSYNASVHLQYYDGS
ncbi:hypothetical protein Tco_0689591 [Tanacetum coccineum]